MRDGDFVRLKDGTITIVQGACDTCFYIWVGEIRTFSQGTNEVELVPIEEVKEMLKSRIDNLEPSALMQIKYITEGE